MQYAVCCDGFLLIGHLRYLRLPWTCLVHKQRVKVRFILTQYFATAISRLWNIVIIHLKHRTSLIYRVAAFARFDVADIWCELAFHYNIIAASSTFALIVAETVVYLHWLRLFFRKAITHDVFMMNICWTLINDCRSTDNRILLIIFVIGHFFRCQDSCHIKFIINLITLIF